MTETVNAHEASLKYMKILPQNQQEASSTDYFVYSEREHLPPLSIPPSSNHHTNHMLSSHMSATSFLNHTANRQYAENKMLQQKLAIQILQHAYCHRLTSRHLESKHLCFFFLPAASMSLIAGILGLVYDNSSFLTPIAILALVSTVWQALDKQTSFNSKAALHQHTADKMKKLESQLTTSGDINLECYHKLYQQAMLEGNPIPFSILSCFGLVNSELQVDGQTGIEFYRTAFDVLVGEVTSSVGFPIVLPSPSRVVERTMVTLRRLGPPPAPPAPPLEIGEGDSELGTPTQSVKSVLMEEGRG
jgi:hypothetical protein